MLSYKFGARNTYHESGVAFAVAKSAELTPEELLGAVANAERERAASPGESMAGTNRSGFKSKVLCG